MLNLMRQAFQNDSVLKAFGFQRVNITDILNSTKPFFHALHWTNNHNFRELMPLLYIITIKGMFPLQHNEF